MGGRDAGQVNRGINVSQLTPESSSSVIAVIGNWEMLNNAASIKICQHHCQAQAEMIQGARGNTTLG